MNDIQTPIKRHEGNHKTAYVLCLALALLFLPSIMGTEAIASSFNVRPVPTQSQLPVSNIYSVFQDKEGFMWYATTGGGLCRDNGYNIHTFTFPFHLQSPGVYNVDCITEDRNGNIWFGTDAGLFRLERKTMTISMPHHLSGYTLALYTAHDGTLWAGVKDTIYHLSADGTKIMERHWQKDAWRTNQFIEDKNHHFYVLMVDHLLKRDKDKWKTINLSQPIDPVQMAWDVNGTCWLATWGKGIVNVNLETGGVTEHPITQQTPDMARCLSMLIDNNNGLMWVTTHDNIYVFRIEGKKLIPYDTSAFMSPENKILGQVYEDRKGNIWVPGYSPHTFVIEQKENDIQRITMNEMREKTGYPLIPDRMVMLGNNIWIHQGRMGLMHYDVNTTQLEMAGGYDYNRCITPYKSQKGLLGAKKQMLMCLSATPSLNETPIDTLPHPITYIRDDGNDKVFLGTSKGIYIYKVKGGNTQQLCSTQGAVNHLVVKNNLIYYLEEGRGLFRVSTTQPQPKQLSCSTLLTAIAINTDGKLWAVSKDGKVMHSTANDSLVEDVQINDGYHESLIDVKCDALGHVWTLSNQRIKEYSPLTHASRSIRNSQPEVNVDYFFGLEDAPNGNIAVGGVGAILMFHSTPELDHLSLSGQRPIVTAIDRGDTCIVCSGENNTFHIPNNCNSIGLQLSTLNITHASNICFAYRIKESSNEWKYLPQGVNSFHISNLPTGSTTILLRATDDMGSWKPKEECITIYRDSVWWQSWWTWSLLLLLAVVPLYGVWLMGKQLQKLHKIHSQRKQLKLTEIAVTQSEDVLPERDNQFLVAAKNRVEQNLSNSQYNVESLASDLCMSRSNLNRRLHTLTGLSPVEFIRDIRLKQAMQLMKEKPSMSMTEVASCVGFASTSYFAKCFKEHFGMLPSQFNNKTNGEK